ncbi:hypothetical protein ACFO4E_13280 [Nocardiopsis mangrovi]|uniref:Uncharacterized protein n=1 Tax=Nocardiopsis mangrovi TaxID=1179818 RepID=A0ABV9DWR8_9ACTN
MMENLLQPGVIEEKAPNWGSEDRREARAQLDNQRAQIEAQLRGLMRGAYGRNDTDFGTPIDDHVEPLAHGARIRIEAGSQLPPARQYITGQLLDNLYPGHPVFAAPNGAVSARSPRSKGY